MVSVWISVNERLPEEEYENVLVVIFDTDTQEKYVSIAYLECKDKYRFSNHDGEQSVTHWMPLPSPPEN